MPNFYAKIHVYIVEKTSCWKGRLIVLGYHVWTIVADSVINRTTHYNQDFYEKWNKVTI